MSDTTGPVSGLGEPPEPPITKAMIDAQYDLRDEYTIVWDGDPMMDGSHERQQMGTWPTLARAQAALGIVMDRSIHAPKENLRIERRRVTPWEVVGDA